MALLEKLSTDQKNAMKSGDAATLSVIRMLIAVIKNKEIEKHGAGKGDKLTDEETVQILMTEAKKRKDAITAFAAGNRNDLAEKEKAELSIIEKYLPEQMSREEVEQRVREIVKKSGATEVGAAMKTVMAELRGKADGRLVQEVVKQVLS